MTSLEQRKKRKNMSKSFVNSGVVEEKKLQQRRFSGDFDQTSLQKSKSLKKMGQQKILPNGFQQKVIVKEFEIEKGGVELIDLIQLYQSAVEYYDSIGDRSNSQLYTEKMQLVFMKPHINKMFQPKKTVDPKKRSKSPPKILTPKKSHAPSNE
jgi:hypothetical protein